MNQATFQGSWKPNPVTGKIGVNVGAQNVPKIKAGLARIGVKVRFFCVLTRMCPLTVCDLIESR